MHNIPIWDSSKSAQPQTTENQSIREFTRPERNIGSLGKVTITKLYLSRMAMAHRVSKAIL